MERKRAKRRSTVGDGIASVDAPSEPPCQQEGGSIIASQAAIEALA